MNTDTHREHDGAIIWVCRDIAGDHVGGPACFCVPFQISADDPRTHEQIMAEIEAKQRPQ